MTDLEPGLGNEIQLTNVLVKLNQQQAVLAYKFKGVRYDVGDKLGFIQATFDFALNREVYLMVYSLYLERVLSQEFAK
ncbi:hypothetical protein [Halalkalibacterium ligniniphilum]|uniref:hypothetical protein n=1 Tax=Halalkalibacterium ligniniphilum TaxID=1134413 RepID=UPI000345AFC7